MARLACVWVVSLLSVAASAQTTTAQTAPAEQTAATAEPSQTTEQGAGTAVAPTAPPRRPVLEPPQSLWLTLSLFGGSNDAELAVSGAESSGIHEDVDAMIDYRRNTRRTTLGMTARSVVRNDARADGVIPMYEGGGISAAFTGVRNQFRASQSVDYFPYYQFGAVSDPNASALGLTAQSHGDFANANLSAFQTTTDVTMSHALGRRDSVSLIYDRRQTQFSDEYLDLLFQKISGMFTHRFTQNLSLHTGYGYRTANNVIPGLPRIQYHELDLGVDYSRALSLSRKTTITFSSGSAILPRDQQLAAAGEAVAGPASSFVVNGRATLASRMGRTWHAALDGSRGVQVLEGFAQPLIVNTIAANLGGNVSRRATFSSAAGFTSGTVGIGGGPGTKYEMWNVSAALQRALSRRWAFDTQYSYFGNRYGRAILLPTGILNEFQRQVLRIGLTWRTPIIEH